jgi:hypothetical protein
MIGKLLSFAWLTCILCLQFVTFTGCVKEYSYEGDPTPDTTLPPHTVKPMINFPACNSCNTVNNFELSTWSLKYQGSILCGSITNAIVATDKTAFTFFGPSACSTDTGLVMTVFLEHDVLDRDKENLTTNL